MFNDEWRLNYVSLKSTTYHIALSAMNPSQYAKCTILIIIIMVISKFYFSGEHIAISIKNKNNNGVNIELGKTNRLKALCMMQINT